jgi:arsenate reductase (thioredoxin)
LAQRPLGDVRAAFRRAADGRHEARSAGCQPGDRPYPVVVEVLRDLGIDASDHVPHRLDDERVQLADVVVATREDACSVLAGKRYIGEDLSDPEAAHSRR